MNQNTGNGVLGGLFGRSTSTKSARENLKGDVTGITPEDIVTSPNFLLVEGILTGSVLVTPKMAENWLSRSNNIRNLMEPTVLLYAENMSKGQWEFNGETIKFNNKGELIDGQHRCAACVRSGKSFMTSVVYGVESADNVDRGKLRTPDQLIKARGLSVKNSITMSAMINFLHAYNDVGSKGFVTVGHGKHPLTMTDRLAFAEENQDELNASIDVTARVRNIFNQPSLHSALHFLFSKTAGQSHADDFYEKLITGVGLSGDDPIYHLREKLIKIRTEKGKHREINPYAGLVIKVWNYYVGGNKILRLSYNYEKEGVAKIKRSPFKAMK
jgi:hypothetical protein